MTEPAIKLLVGLGNPGSEYQDTRHNMGFWFLDLLTQQHAARLNQEAKFYGLYGHLFLANLDLRLLKPLTFVNRSGQAVAAVAGYFAIPPAQILVIHDELDLPSGQVRLKQGGGHAGHNGLRDISSALRSQDFWRLRIGIDRPSERNLVADYVLHRPDHAQAQILEDALRRAITYIPEIVVGNFATVMNQLHSGARKT